MTYEEIKDYINEEIEEQKTKMLQNKPNHYDYIRMIANDIGLLDIGLLTIKN